MFTPGRSRGASATRSVPTHGNGAAGSIPAVTPASIEADFQAWRNGRDWTVRKYAMWEAGQRLPSQKPSSLMECPCGETFDSHRLEHTVIHVPHITEARRAHEVRH
jgi:hypothetical protein